MYDRRIDTSSIPKDLILDINDISCSFRLIGLSLWNAQHYTAMALYNDTWHLYDGIKSPNFLPCTEHFEAVYRPTYCLYALTNSHSETQKLQEPNTNGVDDCSDTDMLKAAMILETLSTETRGKKM
ncbi:uncharacterized protein LOC130613672 [Hydractinia symbiolongicarpus]|uniref:uncharacterized protein LOC130613672 n=1 Tax=Hydractinia symbiolongicarpus TaxID=13093 RepID=UPI00254C70AC|nr:uncharacterized protein LOC130613672 [Hydractinia symbiolongicarpus]